MFCEPGPLEHLGMAVIGAPVLGGIVEVIGQRAEASASFASPPPSPE